MPTEPLTDAEVARARANVARIAERRDPEAAREILLLVPRLLDELEQLRRRDREQAAGEEVLRRQLRDAERRIEMLRVELGQRGPMNAKTPSPR